MTSSSSSRLGLADGWGNIRRLSFNQDQSLFTVASEDGLRVFNVDPIREVAHFRADVVGAIEHAQQLERGNLVAIVSTGGTGAKHDQRSVLIFDPFAPRQQQQQQQHESDDKKGRFVWELTVPDKVLSVRVKRGKLAVVCRSEIHVYDFPGRCEYLYSLSTRDNPRGLCEVSPLRAVPGSSPSSGSGGGGASGSAEIMIFPGYKSGSLQIVDLSTTEKAVSQAPVTINAHRTDLYCLAVNLQSSMIATASNKGTLIRIWDAALRHMLVELRRGSDQALLHCISFSPDDQWLCCSSDKGTVHIFALQDYRLNRRSALASMGVPGAYAGSQWSLASFTVPQECACICSFGVREAGTVFAACVDGSFHKYHFTPEGQCNQMQYDVFTQMCEDCVWEDMRK